MPYKTGNTHIMTCTLFCCKANPKRTPPIARVLFFRHAKGRISVVARLRHCTDGAGYGRVSGWGAATVGGRRVGRLAKLNQGLPSLCKIVAEGNQTQKTDTELRGILFFRTLQTTGIPCQFAGEAITPLLFKVLFKRCSLAHASMSMLEP